MHTVTVVPNPLVIYRGTRDDAEMAHRAVLKILQRQGLSPDAAKINPYGVRLWTVGFYGDDDSVKDAYSVYRDAFDNDFWNECAASPDGWVNPMSIQVRRVAKESKNEGAISFDTPHFKPRDYEGEYILYTLYGLDSDGDELDDIITSPKKSTVIHTIKDLLPDYRRIYNDMHVVAVLYDKDDRMLDSEVVWVAGANESKGADETIEFEKGHKNSRGENAPWVIRDHKNGKVLASFAKKGDAEAHLERMKRYSKNEAASRIVADNRLGKITKARLRDNTLAFYPLEDDGKNDDCIYFFRLDDNDIVTKGYQWGRDEIDYSMIAEDGYPWTAEPGRPTRDYVHTKKYTKYLLDRVCKCLDLGVATEKRHEDAAHLESMKPYMKNENSVMDWANEIKDAVANAAKAAGLENRIAASATNMPKLFVDVYQIGIMGDGINWEITGNLDVRRFDHQDVKRHWRVDNIEELEKSLTDEFQQLKGGKLNGKTEATSISDLLSRLKAADPEKAKYILRAFHDEYGYWVEFPDEVSTYEPGTHTLHEYSVAELLRAYKRSKIVGTKEEGYERATKEIQVRKNGQPWTRYAVTWTEYVDAYAKEAKERGWDEVRVIDLDGRGKHEKLFNVKELENYAMDGYKAAVMAAWSAAGVRNFKIDIQQNSRNIDVLPKTLDGNDIDVSWRIVPDADKVFQYADDLTTGNSEIEREMDFLSDDDLETIFTEEFKTLDETIADGEI